MSNHKRKTIEWLLRGVEMGAVFSAMSWALFWVVTHRRRLASPERPLQGTAIGVAPVAEMRPGHRFDSDDPDGGASLERSRRRRHID
jgi:hypothetical protein